MTETIAIETLLKGLLAQTTILQPTSATPNMSGRTIYGERLVFTDFKIQPADFERILAAIQEEKLLIYPKESLMGWVEGYYLYDINMISTDAELVMAFSDKNIPSSHTLESIFHLCHTQQNTYLLSLLDEWQPIRDNYGDYSYGSPYFYLPRDYYLWAFFIVKIVFIIDFISLLYTLFLLYYYETGGKIY